MISKLDFRDMFKDSKVNILRREDDGEVIVEIIVRGLVLQAHVDKYGRILELGETFPEGYVHTIYYDPYESDSEEEDVSDIE